MAEMADDPQVAELLLLLWDAPDREAGISIVDLPESLRKEELLTACEGAQLIRFARRNHCWHGGGVHRKLVLEPGWSVAELFKPGRKQPWQVLQEAIGEDVPDEIRHRIQLSYRGSAEGSRLALGRTHRDQETPAGHVAFLEMVRDEVHYAAEAKRQQLARSYSNDTLARMVRGIKWDEARARFAALSDLPADAMEQVARVLRRELTVGTVEQIDELLTPVVRKLRDAWEQSQGADSATIVEDEIVVEEPPEVIQLRGWLAVDGIKGHWGHNIASAESWNLDVDARHLNVAFLLRQLMGCDPNQDAIRDYLFRVHGILPSDETDLGKLEQLLRQDAERVEVRHETTAQADDSPTQKKPKVGTEPREGRSDNHAAVRLLSVFTNGLAGERFDQATSVLQNNDLTIEEKLTKIDALIPFPPTASANELGKLFGVSKQAVMKTKWWTKNRKGEKESEIGRRRGKHRDRAKEHEPNRTNDEDE